MPDFSHEITHGRDQGRLICGVDEVGRGPLAGPVVAAAIIIPADFPAEILSAIRDSKKMSAEAREELYEPLTTGCRFAIAEATVNEIDRLNILWASMLAMSRAIRGLREEALHLALIDGNRSPKRVACNTVTIISGDDLSLSIAAASIIAKVHRDRLMKKLARKFPVYGWERNAGYGTPEHLEAVQQHGVTRWHRSGFAPVRVAKELALAAQAQA
jgi:ribonuclease HII